MKNILFVAPWLADFGHGLLLTVLLLMVFELDPTWLYFLLGILFSVLPDLDGVREFFRFGYINAGEHGDHREGLHYPLVWLLAGVSWMLFMPFLGTLFTLCVFVHFLNDSWGTGWGVQWLWPYSEKSYKFFSRNNVCSDVTLQSLVTSWDAEGRRYTARTYSKPNWLEYNYGRFTIVSVMEYGAFIAGFIATILFLTMR